jgi:hypothetical protein
VQSQRRRRSRCRSRNIDRSKRHRDHRLDDRRRSPRRSWPWPPQPPTAGKGGTFSVPRRASFSRVGSLTSTIARQSTAVATAGIHPCCPLAPNRTYPSAAGATALGTEPAGNAGARCHFVVATIPAIVQSVPNTCSRQGATAGLSLPWPRKLCGVSGFQGT